MTPSELTKLRRQRIRIQRQLDKLDPMLAAYRFKLAYVEARTGDRARTATTRAAPELTTLTLTSPMGSHHARRVGHSARGRNPLPIRVIAARALVLGIPGANATNLKLHGVCGPCIEVDQRGVIRDQWSLTGSFREGVLTPSRLLSRTAAGLLSAHGAPRKLRCRNLETFN